MSALKMAEAEASVLLDVTVYALIEFRVALIEMDVHAVPDVIGRVIALNP